jgi:hypothetical protein
MTRLSTRLAASLMAMALFLSGSPASAQAPSHAGHSPRPTATPSQDCNEPSLHCARSASAAVAPDGRLWLAWIAGGVVSVAASKDRGEHFGEPIALAASDPLIDTGPDARAQIVVTPQGTIVVVWAGFKDRNWNARLHLARSIDGGAHFSAPSEPITNPASARFPAMTASPDGEIHLAWLDKRLVAAERRAGHGLEGASLAWARSTDQGMHFGPVQIASKTSCECCRIALARPFRDAPGALPVMVLRGLLPGSIRDHVRIALTGTDQAGAASLIADDHWVTQVCPHQGPALAIDGGGTEHAAWFTAGTRRQGLFYARTRSTGSTDFSAPEAIDDAAHHPARPALLAIGNTVWLAWKALLAGETVIKVRVSDDNGRHWRDARVVATTRGYSDHPQLIALEGKAALSWLARREGYRLIDLEATR